MTIMQCQGLMCLEKWETNSNIVYSSCWEFWTKFWRHRLGIQIQAAHDHGDQQTASQVN